jgi:hypothetical protein
MDSQAPTAQGAPLRAVYEFQCSEAECIAALTFNQARLIRRWSHSRTAIVLRVLTLAASLGFVSFAVSFVLDIRGGPGTGLGLCLGAVVALTIFSQMRLRRAFFRVVTAGDGTLRSRRILSVAEEGLRFRSHSEDRFVHSEWFVAWNGIRSIEQLGRQILVYQDDFSFISIPGSAFTGLAEQAEFIADLRRRAGISQRPARALSIQAAPLAAGDEAARDDHRGRANVPGNILRGLRLAFFLKPERDGARAPDGSWSALVALMFLGVALPFLVDLLQVGPKGSFDFSALPEAVFGLPVLMVGAWALARLFGRPRDTLTLLVALTSLTVSIELIDILVHLATKGRLERFAAAESPFAVLSNFLVPIWLTLAASVGAIRLLGAQGRRRLAAFLLTGLLLGLPLTIVDRHPTLWWAPRDEEAASSRQHKLTALANEDVFYLQPKLLEQQLAALKPGRRGVIDLYFIGLAAYARQDVFMKEVHSVAEMFDKRFDTAGRSLMLINNPATVNQSPIASSTSLGLALKRVGEVMDRDEDILFLFITSHGSRDHTATFDFWPMQFNTLDPGRLKALLDQSGIKRRVVVVSACYSGAFVDALKDDGTLVIAASAADKNSFGCSNDADFTYFGKAYFDEALRKTYSFSEAFEMARPVIAEREQQAHFSGSNPQMFVGAGIKRALAEFVRSRESKARRASERLVRTE